MDDTAFVYTGEYMSFEEGEREERGDGQAGGEGGTRAQTPVSSLPSFLCFFFFFFHESPL